MEDRCCFVYVWGKNPGEALLEEQRGAEGKLQEELSQEKEARLVMVFPSSLREPPGDRSGASGRSR